MTQAINTLVTSALNAATTYGDCVAKLRTQLKGQMSPDVRVTLLPYVAGFYAVPTFEGKQGLRMAEYINKKGTEMRKATDADAVKVLRYEAAKKALQRMTGDIVGKTAAHAEPVALTRAQLALIKQCHAAGITMKMFGQGVAQIK